MKCKNCHTVISDKNRFCPNCGAKVIHERISLKNIISSLFSTAFGWDNKFFFTLRSLFLRPQKVFKAHIEGVRKRYVNPFAFFAIGAALSLLVFNHFAEDYIRMGTNFNGQIEAPNNATSPVDSSSIDSLTEINTEQLLIQKEQLEINTKVQRFILKYFNLASFLLLPLYTLLSFWVFGKPFNFGEHLTINAYINGFLFILVLVLFLIGLVTSPIVYYINIIFVVIYYTYAYKRLYKLSFGRSLLKILTFLVILLAITIVISIVAFAIGAVVKNMQ
jgi:hypothetical protein